MLGYATVGTNDLVRAVDFYEKILAPLGGKKLVESPHMTFFTDGMSLIAVTRPYNQSPASFGNGAMLGLGANSPKTVDRIYEIAMKEGAESEGAPAYRVPNMYIGYFRDPTGNKLAAYYMPSINAFANSARVVVEEMLKLN